MMTAQPSVADVRAVGRPHAADASPPSAAGSADPPRRPKRTATAAARTATTETTNEKEGAAPHADEDADADQREEPDADGDADADQHADAADAADGGPTAGPAPSKKARRELPPHTVAILKGWMLSPEHVKHPYPTDEDKQMLLQKTGINMKQLTNWFTNARKRIWKPMMRREHSRQLQHALELDKARPPAGYPPYADAGYPRAVRHSFDAGSLGAPREPPLPYDPYARHAPPPVPSPALGAFGAQAAAAAGPPAFAPRALRSLSEAPRLDEYEQYQQFRKRALDELGGGGGGGFEGDKRARLSAQASPRGLRVLQDWVAARAGAQLDAAQLGSEAERLQLARDAGIDPSQIDAWIQSLHDRAAVPREQPAPPPPLYPPRRSIPGQGNSMFPPRPTATAARSSIPGAGNPQFPPPPAARRELEDDARAAGGSGGAYYGYPEPLRGGRSLSIGGAQFLHPPPPTVSESPPLSAAPSPHAAVGIGGLPSLSSRNLLPPAPPGPTMGQPRDGRSHTLDMGQFADARRRRMNFQDILASTKAAQAAQAAAQAASAASASAAPAVSAANAENVYPNRGYHTAAAREPEADAPPADGAVRIV